MVRACSVPSDTLLARYHQRDDCYADCFEAFTTQTVSLQQFIEAFYTSWLFRLERMVLMAVMRRRISDDDVTALADGAPEFAAWTVEDRRPGEILLADMGGRTRSYLGQRSEGNGTRLLFGSAVIPARTGDSSLGAAFTVLMPLHRFYSRALLSAARKNIRT